MSEGSKRTFEDITYPYGDRLYIGERLKKGEGLVSSDHRIQLVLQTDNNLAIHALQHSSKPWETSTKNYNVEYAELTEDGLNLVDEHGETVWTTRGYDSGWFFSDDNYAVLQNDGDLVLWTQVDHAGGPVWSSNSAHFRPKKDDFPMFAIETLEWLFGGWKAPIELEKMNEYTITFTSPESGITVQGPSSHPDVLSFKLDKATLRLIGDNSVLTGEIPNLVFSRESDEARVEGALPAQFTHNTPLCLNHNNSKSVTRHLPDNCRSQEVKLALRNTKWMFDSYGFLGKVEATYWDGSKQKIDIAGSASGAIWTMENSVQYKRSGEWISL